MIAKYYDISCNVCAQYASIYKEQGLEVCGMGTSRKEMERYIKSFGWISMNGIHLCPDCSKSTVEKIEEKVYIHMTLGDIEDECRHNKIKVSKNRKGMEQRLITLYIKKAIENNLIKGIWRNE